MSGIGAPRHSERNVGQGIYHPLGLRGGCLIFFDKTLKNDEAPALHGPRVSTSRGVNSRS